MQQLANIQNIRLAASAFAALSGIVTLLLIEWPAWAVSLAEGSIRLPWQAGGWSEVLIDAEGRVGPNTHHSLLLATVAVLLAATVTVACFDFLSPSQEGDRGAGPPRDSSTQVASVPAPPNAEELNVELFRVLQLLRAFLEANGLHGAALAKVNAQLPDIGSPDQFRLVVSYLMTENESMRTRTREMQNSLETSKKQIENLKGNLAQAKAEGLSDALTSLKNRRAFDLALAGEVVAARKSSRPLSVIIADVDRFKSVNDRFGHPAGDDLLRWLGRIFATNVKGRDTAARYGGEEFGIILPQTMLSDAATLADQIRHNIETAPWLVPDGTDTRITVTTSFGVAELRGGETSEALLRRADAKLYEAKQGGRNRVMS